MIFFPEKKHRNRTIDGNWCKGPCEFAGKNYAWCVTENNGQGECHGPPEGNFLYYSILQNF